MCTVRAQVPIEILTELIMCFWFVCFVASADFELLYPSLSCIFYKHIVKFRYSKRIIPQYRAKSQRSTTTLFPSQLLDGLP